MHHFTSSKPNGDHTYFLEVDLLETDCHVFDPTPIANCTVRPKALTVRVLMSEPQESKQMQKFL